MHGARRKLYNPLLAKDLLKEKDNEIGLKGFSIIHKCIHKHCILRPTQSLLDQIYKRNSLNTLKKPAFGDNTTKPFQYPFLTMKSFLDSFKLKSFLASLKFMDVINSLRKNAFIRNISNFLIQF